MSNVKALDYPKALSIAPYERMRIALCLAAVGGFLEAYTFTLKGGVFANAQTGNLVTCAVRLAQRDPAAALRSLLPIVAFVLGIMLTERLKRLPHENTPEQWHCIVIVTELALLLVVTFLPTGLPDFATTLIVSFVCALQYGSFRKTHGLPYATTFCTGNLRSAGTELFKALQDHSTEAGHHARRYFTVVGVFFGGALISGLICPHLGQRSTILCCGVLVAVLIIFLLDYHKRKRFLKDVDQPQT